MTYIGCRPAVESLTVLFAEPAIAARLRELHAARAEAAAFIEALTASATPEIAATIRMEFAELPSVTAFAIIEAWAMADGAGKRFELVSAPPEHPLDFARHSRVRIAIDAEEDCVRVSLSHVPTRHAAWYAPRVLAAVGS